MSPRILNRHPEHSRLLNAQRCSPYDPRTWRLRWHLSHCAHCRNLCKEEEELLFAWLAPFEQALDQWTGDESASRQRLLSNMRSSLAPLPATRASKLSASRPGVLAFGVLLVSACLLYMIAVPARIPAVTVADVLNRAAAIDDTAESGPQPGVTFRRVEITAGSQRLEWSSYHDGRGKRKARLRQSSSGESRLDQRLASAGITKDDPLSATSYRLWRSHLGSFTDNIVHAPSGLYIITTSLPADSHLPIKEETLTLRGDYHPIRKTVAFRDSEEIEVAELDYQVLRGDQIREGLFDDFKSASPITVPVSVPRKESASPELPDGDLTYAELQARLALSRSSLDVDEHLTLVRHSDGIHVEGVVSSPEKKQAINEALVHVPHVREEIQSPTDMDRAGGDLSVGQSQKVTIVQTISQPSPLYVYWKNQNGKPDELPLITAKMLEAALRINQQSHALLEVTRHFASDSSLDDRSHISLLALIRDHAEKLQVALSMQHQELELLKVASPPKVTTLDINALSGIDGAVGELDRQASRSLALTHQLNTGDESGKVDAQTMLSELDGDSTAIAALLDRILLLNR